jgi:hypothetical protein
MVRTSLWKRSWVFSLLVSLGVLGCVTGIKAPTEEGPAAAVAAPTPDAGVVASADAGAHKAAENAPVRPAPTSFAIPASVLPSPKARMIIERPQPKSVARKKPKSKSAKWSRRHAEAQRLQDGLGEAVRRLEQRQLWQFRNQALRYRWKKTREPRRRKEAWRRWRELEEKVAP